MKKITLILSLLISSLSYSAELIVNQSGLPGSYLTIQSAIDAANPGDIILLDDGDVPYGSFTIDKDINIQPFNSSTDVREVITPVENIFITSDSVNQIILNSLKVTGYISVSRYDSLDNTITYIDVINCDIDGSIEARIPKVSINMYYSDILGDLRCMHGQFIANLFHSKLIISDYPTANHNLFNDLTSCTTDSVLISDYVNFPYSQLWGSNNLISDTINIIANRFLSSNNDLVYIASRYFNINVRNNKNEQGGYFEMAYLNYQNGGNNYINNSSRFEFFYLNYNGWMVIDDYSNTRVLNNNTLQGYNPIAYCSGLLCSNNINQFTIPQNKRGLYAYNKNLIQGDLFNQSEDGNIGSPSNEFLNLDLTRNIQGNNGGSYAWDNYYSQNSTGNYRLNKARIVDLNLPTQIFDPANISIKVKATHKN